MSTGDSRRSAPKKSATPAAADDTDAVVEDGPVGGVLPVKKAVPRAGGKAGGGGAAGRTGGNGTTRTNGTARTNGAARSATKAAPSKAAPAKSTAAKSAATKTAPAGRSTVTETVESTPSVFSRKSTTKTPSRTPSLLGGGKGGGGKGGRRVAAPVKVAERRNWGPILLFVATGALALGIIGWGAWPLLRDATESPWQERAGGIPGIINYIDPSSPNYSQASTLANHQIGDLTYPVSPPVGGNHNGHWQNCMGDVYPAQIADEHAVHSLEHGAIWVTYSPDLPQDQIDKLASKVRDQEYMLMSPYPGLDSNISLQAWGYQLKVDNADDGRIDDFISALKKNAAREEGAACSQGITDTGSTPLDLAGGM